jgi:hypothetical protein
MRLAAVTGIRRPKGGGRRNLTLVAARRGRHLYSWNRSATASPAHDRAKPQTSPGQWPVPSPANASCRPSAAYDRNGVGVGDAAESGRPPQDRFGEPEPQDRVPVSGRSRGPAIDPLLPASSAPPVATVQRLPTFAGGHRFHSPRSIAVAGTAARQGKPATGVRGTADVADVGAGLAPRVILRATAVHGAELVLPTRCCRPAPGRQWQQRSNAAIAAGRSRPLSSRSQIHCRRRASRASSGACDRYPSSFRRIRCRRWISIVRDPAYDCCSKCRTHGADPEATSAVMVSPQLGCGSDSRFAGT